MKAVQSIPSASMPRIAASSGPLVTIRAQAKRSRNSIIVDTVTSRHFAIPRDHTPPRRRLPAHKNDVYFCIQSLFSLSVACDVKNLMRSMAHKFGIDVTGAASARPEPSVNTFTLIERVLKLEPDPVDRTDPPHDGVDDPFPKEAVQPTKTLIVEGWRFLPHSYAIVNQWHLLALLRRPSIAVKVVDMPFSHAKWRAQEGLFDPRTEQLLKSIAIADPDEDADLTLRMFYRYDFSPSRSPQTVVFGTLEQQLIRPSDIRASDRLRMPPPPSVRAMTPSLWSAEGYYRAGFTNDQVLIVPHGVDVETFHPMPHLRNRIRSRISVADGDFVFLSIGAMTGNKGMDLLLQAFAAVSHRFPHARLLLKGMDPLYTSKDFVLKSLWRVPPQDLQRVGERVIYFGNSCSYRQMSLLYQAADAYVSPYRAEAFNMPVLEAAACGLPVICTAGGSTDDFVLDAFARRIESKKISVRIKSGLDAARLEPSVDHLIELMTSAIEDHSWRSQAAERGPEHVRSHFTWDRVTDILISEIVWLSSTARRRAKLTDPQNCAPRARCDERRASQANGHRFRES